MNIAIFGGRFDPIHRGHIALAEAAIERCSLRQVLFVPASVPPHKQQQSLTAFVHRYAMVALATADDKRFVPSLLEASDAEASREDLPKLGSTARKGSKGQALADAAQLARVAPNYTIDTVRRLKGSLRKADRLFLLIGVDAFRDIAKWHEARALLGECEFVVASRPGYSLRDVAEALPEELRPPKAVTQPFQKQPASGDLVLPGVTLHLLEGVHQNVSATAIREAAARGKPLLRWLDPRVAEYVKKMGLYKVGG
ncbi:MAG: nicotinate-nucleotide adenylyltransferase [Terriglobales bacterium]|jgi:nicotinate-nucleotide adenylyltransferase